MPNEKAEYRNGSIMLSFQMNPGFACSILVAIYLSGSSEETASRLLAFDISIGNLYRCDDLGRHWVHDTHISNSNGL